MTEDLSLDDFNHGDYRRLAEHVHTSDWAPPAIQELREQPETLEAITQFLSHLGIARLAVNRSGAHATTYFTTRRQLVRIGTIFEGGMSREEIPTEVPEVVQPLVRTRIGGLVVEVLPQLNPPAYDYGNGMFQNTPENLFVFYRDMYATMLSLAERGFLFWDPIQGNEGYFDDGTPVVLDRGAVVSLKNAKAGHWRRLNEIMHWKFSEEDLPVAERQQQLRNAIRQSWESFAAQPEYAHKTQQEKTLPVYDYETAQREHLKKHGLEPGKVSGVVGYGVIPQMEREEADYLERHDNRPPHLSHAALVKTAGGYKEVIKQAARKLGQGENPGAPFTELAGQLKHPGPKTR